MSVYDTVRLVHNTLSIFKFYKKYMHVSYMTLLELCVFVNMFTQYQTTKHIRYAVCTYNIIKRNEVCSSNNYFVDHITYFLTGHCCKVSNFLSRYRYTSVADSYSIV